MTIRLRNILKLWAAILAIPFFVVTSFNTCLAAEKKEAKGENKVEKSKTTKAVIETKHGNMEIKFYPDVAPDHVKNFIKLAKEGFYDGTIFHRVIPGFMIQGGDPNTKGPNKNIYGAGGPGYNVKAEFNKMSHKRGILSMARSQHPDSAGSQFFIVVKDSTFLDNQYTVFGEVVNGMDAADKIVNLPRDSRDLPNERVEMKVKIIE
ncbi:MAG: peptidylprolyl isomerase [Deltaproteobacteria bacterium]|nr:peptidylprolyl isomerase [Deltaproteobacteria bacterium]